MKIAVFGAGTMGSGIAQVFAAKGHTALMYASSVQSAQRHKDKLAASLAKKVAKGKMDQAAADDIMSRILVEEFDAAADADENPGSDGQEKRIPDLHGAPQLFCLPLLSEIFISNRDLLEC